MTWKNLSSTSVLAVIVLGMNLVGCSSQTHFLQNVGLNVSQQGQESVINLSAKVDFGNASLGAIAIPVNDPHTGLNIGEVSLDGSMITLSVNASSLLSADPSLGSELPNGRPIPSALGAASGELLAFPILNHSRVYVGGDLKTHVIAGVALAIQGMDGVMGSIGAPANLFFSQTFGSVVGVAGVYGSPDANESGIAVFANYTMPQSQTQMLMTQSVSRTVSHTQTARKAAEVKINQGLSEDDEYHVYNYFYGKRRVLRPH